MRRALVLVIACAASHAYADDKATAEAAYMQAKLLAKDNKWAEACPLFLVSYRADRQVGVLLNLADCHEHDGKLATAWGEFREADELAAKAADARAAYARERAEALLPRLAKLKVTAVQVPGLIVQRDDTEITRLLGVEAPVDAGDHVIVATAPGFVEWRKPIAITGEGTTATVEIPALAKLPEPKVDPKVVERVIVQTPVEYDYRDRNARRALGLRIAVPGAVVVVAGLGFGFQASRAYDNVTHDPVFCDDAFVCNDAGKDKIDRARGFARIADVAVALGGAALVTGIVLYATAPNGVRKEAPKSVRLAPMGRGVALIGAF